MELHGYKATGDAMKAAGDEPNLDRAGERAARDHRPWHANPFLQRENMPIATGETLREWSRKHDAWQRGQQIPRGGYRLTSW